VSARGPFTRGLDLVVAAAEWLAVALLVAMVVVVSLAVYFRYLLGSPLGWYDEVASFLLVWLTFVGGVVVTRRRRHIGFELLVERQRPAARRALEIAAELLVLAFEALIVVYGWNLVARMGDETSVSLLWLEVGWVYAVMPASAALMALVTLRRLAALLTGAPLEGPGAGTPVDATE
jgi:TRAP-type C4-dicarboxylate transport system permease small subunit